MKKLIFIQIIHICFSLNISAQSKTAQIDSLLNNYYEKGELNGAVLVEHKGEVIYKNAFGVANANWDIKNTLDSKFHLFSITKQFTAILILQLVEEGMIDLQKTINDYLPYYREDSGNIITIDHLLLHTHGIPDIEYKKLPMKLDLNPEELISKYASGDLEFEPGSQHKYSAISGYTILAAIIEKVTGKSYEQVLTDKILHPLKMKNSGFIHFDRSVKKMTTSYWKSLDTIRIEFFMFDCNGSSSIYTTVEDMFLYSKGLDENILLSADSKKLLFSPLFPLKNYFYSYGGGYAKFLMNDKEIKMVAISGGGRNTIAKSLNGDFNVVLLNNMYSPGGIYYEVLRILYQ